MSRAVVFLLVLSVCHGGAWAGSVQTRRSAITSSGVTLAPISSYQLSVPKGVAAWSPLVNVRQASDSEKQPSPLQVFNCINEKYVRKVRSPPWD